MIQSRTFRESAKIEEEEKDRESAVIFFYRECDRTKAKEMDREKNGKCMDGGEREAPIAVLVASHLDLLQSSSSSFSSSLPLLFPCFHSPSPNSSIHTPEVFNVSFLTSLTR